MWVLSRYDDIVRAGQEWETFSSAHGNMMTELPNRAGATLGTTDPPRHDRLRGLIQYAFTQRNLDGLAEPIREIARAAAEGLKGRREFDYINDFSSKFTVRVLFMALGLPRRGRHRHVRDKAVPMVQNDPVTRAKGPEHIAAFEWMRDYATRIIDIRRQNPAQRSHLAFRPCRDRRRQTRRPRGVAHHHHAHHGGHRVARRLHDACLR